jgi:DNA-binding response OmpR family regulator
MTPTVLLVDDDATSVAACTELLACEGCRVLTASSGAQALACVAREHPDLAVMETRIGRESGLEYLSRMKALDSSLHVILYTDQWCYRDDFTSWLADAYLLKERGADALQNAVREFTRGHALAPAGE